QHFARARRHQVIDQLESGSLSRAAAPKQDKRLPALNLQVESVEQFLSAQKAVCNLPEFDDGPVLMGIAHTGEPISQNWMAGEVEKTMVFRIPEPASATLVVAGAPPKLRLGGSWERLCRNRLSGGSIGRRRQARNPDTAVPFMTNIQSDQESRH